MTDQNEANSPPADGAGAAENGTPRRRQYRRSGAYAVRSAISTKGLAGIDSDMAREMAAISAAYAADLGGDLTTGQAVLLEALVGQLAILRAIDAALGTRPDWVVVRRTRELSQLARDRAAVAARVRDICTSLGLERRTKEAPSLAEYLRGRVAAALPEAPAARQLAAPVSAPQPEAIVALEPAAVERT